MDELSLIRIILGNVQSDLVWTLILLYVTKWWMWVKEKENLLNPPWMIRINNWNWLKLARILFGSRANKLLFRKIIHVIVKLPNFFSLCRALIRVKRNCLNVYVPIIESPKAVRDFSSFSVFLLLFQSIGNRTWFLCETRTRKKTSGKAFYFLNTQGKFVANNITFITQKNNIANQSKQEAWRQAVVFDLFIGRVILCISFSNKGLFCLSTIFFIIIMERSLKSASNGIWRSHHRYIQYS